MVVSAMAEHEHQITEAGGVRAVLWASAGLIVGAFYLGYYCAKLFFLN